ncbi:Butanol dehydrogenase-like protein [Aduncisulcus paluster]|uniref:Butanol dehydrogenase-like protein n=1 Tax=Aduncisulcus paluster TaxID=2918883 RepID=A0ABQ5K7J5_9EUKA|nr:Butanol dehydrogenase-like protein [Aduncisulcus paluster]
MPADHDPWEIMEFKYHPTSIAPLYTVLTLSASASEQDPSFVISNIAKDLKFGRPLPPLGFPVASLVDPEFQKTVPRHHVAHGAIDALVHTIDTYFGAYTDIDDKTSKVAVAPASIMEGIFHGLVETADKILGDTSSVFDYHARADLCWLCSAALNGIPQCGAGGDWTVHMIEHACSAAIHKMTHAAADPCPLPEDCLGVDTVEEGVKEWRGMLKRWGVAVEMGELIKNLGWTKSHEEFVKEVAAIYMKMPISGMFPAMKPEFAEEIIRGSFGL